MTRNVLRRDGPVPPFSATPSPSSPLSKVPCPISKSALNVSERTNRRIQTSDRPLYYFREILHDICTLAAEGNVSRHYLGRLFSPFSNTLRDKSTTTVECGPSAEAVHITTVPVPESSLVHRVR